MKYFSSLKIAGLLAAAMLVACAPKDAPVPTETSEKTPIEIDDAVLKQVRPVYEK